MGGCAIGIWSSILAQRLRHKADAEFCIKVASLDFPQCRKNARILGFKMPTATVAAPILDSKTATAMVVARILDSETVTATVAARMLDSKTATATVVARILDPKTATTMVAAHILDFATTTATVAADVLEPKIRMFSAKTGFFALATLMATSTSDRFCPERQRSWRGNLRRTSELQSNRKCRVISGR